MSLRMLLRPPLLAAALMMSSPLSQAQTFVFNHGSSTTVTSPSGVTTIHRTGNGYTVVAPNGVTTVNRFGDGQYNVVGPGGFTSVFPNGSGGYTVIGDAAVVPIIPNPGDQATGFTAVGRDGSSREIVPFGDGGLLMIGD